MPNTATTRVHIATRLVASGPWLDRLNAWRANAGLPSLAENSPWSAGDYDHAIYMVKNDLVTHYETPGTPYYTAAGDAAARNGNIQVSSTTNTTDVQAIDWWMAAPFHAMGMMDPRLTQTGFGSYREVKSGWQTGFALDTIRDNSFSGGTYPVYFPGNGTSEPLTSYGGAEFPDPLQACPGYSAPTGLPVFIEVGGNVNTTAGAVHSFTGNGVPLSHCVIDSSNSALSSYLYSRGGVILIPQQPLQSGVRYVVALLVNGVPYTWSFSVGPSLSPQLAVTDVSPHGGPVAGGTAVTITGRGFSTGTTAVKFGTSLASGFTVMNDTTITAVSQAHAAGTVDVTVTGPSGTSATSPFDQFSFGACTSATMSPPAGSSFAAGGTVAFTAGAGGCPAPEFEFWVLPPGSYWQMGQAYSPSPNFSWNTSGLVPGGYQVVVWVRQHGDGTATYDVGAGGNYTLTTAGACTSATMSPPAGSSFAAGSTVAYTAGAGSCSSPEFEFWVLAPGSYWIMRQAYSPNPKFSWNTSELTPGGYQVVVWVRQHGNGTPTYDVGAGGNYTLTTAGACTAAMSPPAGSSFAVSSTVAFTAGAGGCPSPEFEFWVLPPGSYWQMLRAYGASPNFSWNTTGLVPGGYQVVVWVREHGSGTATYEAGAGGNYTLTGCTSATMSPPAGSSFTAGSTVTFTAGAGGCTSPEFEFWVLAPGSYWIMGRAYSASPNFSWNTTGLAPGGYQVVVWVRQRGSGTATYEAGSGGNYTLT